MLIAVEREVSEESAVWGAGAGGGMARFRMPHKLQIVKPLEGSLTLHTWSQLAKPTMSGNYSALMILNTFELFTCHLCYTIFKAIC